ncbi:MAG: NAD(P)-binding domain-containing protein, partial [Solirubrobacteraceae bacterium]
MTQILSAPVFDERIESRSARVGIIGLGYAGLPLALAFAEAGFSVRGLDVDARKVAGLADGSSCVDDV